MQNLKKKKGMQGKCKQLGNVKMVEIKAPTDKQKLWILSLSLTRNSQKGIRSLLSLCKTFPKIIVRLPITLRSLKTSVKNLTVNL